MKPAFFGILFSFCSLLARAELAETVVEWRPACDGATIEVISDNNKIQSVRAIAFHSHVIVEWTVHYVDGASYTAEYRKRKRGRILEGDRAGAYSGDNPLQQLVSAKARDGKFSITDKKLSEELSEIIASANSIAKNKKPKK